MKFVLILWMTVNGDSPYPDGGLTSADFNTKAACEDALTEIRENSISKIVIDTKYPKINGVCVSKG